MHVDGHLVAHAQEKCAGIFHAPFFVRHDKCAIGRTRAILKLHLDGERDGERFARQREQALNINL